MKKMYPFIEWRFRAYGVTGALFLIFLIGALTRGINFGIDFVGGTSIIVKFDKPIDTTMMADLRTHLDQRGIGGGSIRTIAGAGGSAEEAREISIDIRGSDWIDKAVAQFEQSKNEIASVDDLDRVFSSTIQSFALQKLKAYFLPPAGDTATPALYNVKSVTHSDLENIFQVIFNEDIASSVQEILEEKMPPVEAKKSFDLNNMRTGENLARELANARRAALESRLAEMMTETGPRAWTSVDEFLTRVDMMAFDGPALRRRLSADTQPAPGSVSVLSATPRELSEAFMDVFTERFRRNAQIVVTYRDQQHGGIFASTQQAADYVPADDGEMRQMIMDHGYVGRFIIASSETVGATIGKDLVEDAFWAIVVSILGILAYIWFRFEIRYGVGAIVALLHDTLLTLGLIWTVGWEFNVPIVAAILTVMGYSVNDTIVVYDRIREKLGNLRGSPDPAIIDIAITETLSRTIRTGGTTIISILAFMVFGPAVTRDLSFALGFGIIIGTFSSIFVAAPVLVEWDRLTAHFAAKKKARSKGDVRPVR
ncbi:MAG: protein translocase subunit SecF [Candidatus Hydrogenedentota bacterium]